MECLRSIEWRGRGGPAGGVGEGDRAGDGEVLGEKGGSLVSEMRPSLNDVGLAPRPGGRTLVTCCAPPAGDRARYMIHGDTGSGSGLPPALRHWGGNLQTTADSSDIGFPAFLPGQDTL